jgi:hypothetical protein
MFDIELQRNVYIKKKKNYRYVMKLSHGGQDFTVYNILIESIGIQMEVW